MKDTDRYGFSLKKYGFPSRNCGVSVSLTLQRRAGWTTGGVGDYVDTPVAWTELAQLAQCKGQVQEGETLVGD